MGESFAMRSFQYCHDIFSPSNRTLIGLLLMVRFQRITGHSGQEMFLPKH